MTEEENNKSEEVKQKLIQVLQTGVPAVLLAITTGQSMMMACTTMIFMPLMPWIIEQLIILFGLLFNGKSRSKEFASLTTVTLSSIEYTIEGDRSYNPHYQPLTDFIQGAVSSKTYALKPRNHCHKITWFFSPSSTEVVDFEWTDENTKETHKFSAEVKEAENSKDAEPKQYMNGKTIVLYGKNKEVIDLFLRSITEKRESQVTLSKEDTKYSPWIYHYNIEHKDWESTKQCANKSYDKLFMRKNDKQRLVDDVANFQMMREKAVELGVPYKRGYLLYGTPGCGKTSAVHAISRETGMDVYVMDIKNMCVEDYENALNHMEPQSILFFDDIDTNKLTWSRQEEEVTPQQNQAQGNEMLKVLTAMATSEKKENGMNSFFAKTQLDLSNLLKSLDGYENLDGCIVIMNTNHPEKLDSALIREGRIDVRIEFKFCDRDQLEQVACAIYGAEIATEVLDGIDMDKFESHQFSVSKVLVGWMLPHCNNWEKARETLIKNVNGEYNQNSFA